MCRPHDLRPPSHRFELSSLQSINNFQLQFPHPRTQRDENGNGDDDDDDGYDDDIDDDDDHHDHTDGDSGALSMDADSAAIFPGQHSQVQTPTHRRLRPLSPLKALNRGSNGNGKQSPRKKDRSWSEGLVRHDATMITAQQSRETTEALRWEISLLTKEVSHLRAENEKFRASLGDIGAIADAAALARVATTPEKSCGPL